MRYVLVMSGKGGVGKSTVAANLARALAKAEGSVGLLDLDLTGPSIPTFFGIQSATLKNNQGKMVPVEVDGVQIVSIGLMLNGKNDAVVWRGPRKNGMIQSFFEMVDWHCNTVVIDLPPGTSDEHLTTIDVLKKSGAAFSALIVTTPNVLAVADVRKGLNLCTKTEVPVMGFVENFSGIICPCCGEVEPLLGSDAVDELAAETELPILAKLPFIPGVAAASDAGVVEESIFPRFAPILDAIGTI